eukprot:TRINITY_DN5601_c0_g1_i1.p1 TRINITY_DN5601_c0_g1~~TRINITY_DN5601_c0_g1_i1.p1  ORF type:complete len:558 (-),score=64.76 TRINITY_DN5601_c0_g1_i1:114-1730(-)
MVCHGLHVLGDVPTVTTACGKVEGERLADFDVYGFRGIPYGAPPTQKMRWKPPVPASCWSGVLKATSFGNICYQSHVPFAVPLRQDEDCLNLDVYVPVTPDHTSQSLPVIFWLYGGSNYMGWSSAYPNLENLANEKQVIVVSINYRVGMLGYLSSVTLSEHDPRGVSGNYGILDAQLALKWVQKNIAAFGGDPSRVTLLGQSSGGTNILALQSNPRNTGLFHAAISLSASPGRLLSQAEAAVQNENISESLGCSKSDYNCLIAADAATVTEKMPLCWWREVFPELPVLDQGRLNLCALVVRDNVTVFDFEDAYSTGRAVDVPTIFQTTSQEPAGAGTGTIMRSSVPEVQAMVNNWANNIGPALGDAPLGETMLAEYASNYRVSAEDGYFSMLAEIYMGCGNRYLAQLAANSFRSPVFSGLMAHFPEFTFNLNGNNVTTSFHCWDYFSATKAWLGFGNSSGYVPGQTDIAIGNIIQDDWFRLVSTLRSPSAKWKPVAPLPSRNATSIDVGVYVAGGFEMAHVGATDTCQSFGDNVWIVN